MPVRKPVTMMATADQRRQIEYLRKGASGLPSLAVLSVCCMSLCVEDSSCGVFTKVLSSSSSLLAMSGEMTEFVSSEVF